MVRYSEVSKEKLIKLCVTICLVNILLVSILAGAGILKTAERGDVRYTDVDPGSDGSVVLPENSDDSFVIEQPNDVDAFYNMVIRVQNGLQMYNDEYGAGSGAGEWHYHPLLYFLFAPISFFGYFWFKILWLITSIIATISGTYLLVHTEVKKRCIDIRQSSVYILSVSSAGFMPMISNFKLGHPTPLLYLMVGISWWSIRSDNHELGGIATVVNLLIKPYTTTHLAAFSSKSGVKGILSFIAGAVISNVLTMFVFDLETLKNYYITLLDFISPSGNAAYEFTFQSWWSIKMDPFLMFGWLSPIIQVTAWIVLGAASIHHLLSDSNETLHLFSFSIVSIFFMITSYSFIDAALLLAPFTLIGIKYYDEGSKLFYYLTLSFLLFQIHAYYMETIVGYGATVISIIKNNEEIVGSVIPYAQPAVYGLIILITIISISYYRSIHSTNAY